MGQRRPLGNAPRLFLRTAEFLWQEGHTAHETAEEAMAETQQMLRVYETFAREYLALPVLAGEKSEAERFPGAVQTLCIEAMVQDRKAIQAGTSHFLGQNFAKASGIKFQSREGREELAWTTSWGMSTRMIGTVIMPMRIDDGLVLPPRIAPTQIVILPITQNPKPATRSSPRRSNSPRKLRAQTAFGETISVEVDKRDIGGGTKSWEWIKKGVPIRVELGRADLEKGSVAVARRDRGRRTRRSWPMPTSLERPVSILEKSRPVCSPEPRPIGTRIPSGSTPRRRFYAFFTAKNASKPRSTAALRSPIGTASREVEETIKEDLKVTIRCIPFDGPEEDGRCILTGEPSKRRVVWAKSY